MTRRKMMNAITENILRNALKCAEGDVEKTLELAGPSLSPAELKEARKALTHKDNV
jgi:hypothetical protein